MKLLQLLENMAPQFPTTKEEVEAILDKYDIMNYAINDDLSVDVDGNVSLEHKNLQFIPVIFGTVSGYFDCCDNEITSLRGAPKIIRGYFDCSSNLLSSLQGSPREADGHFWCNNNQLTSLKGSPREVGGLFDCDSNNLDTLQGSPREVGRDFKCRNNPKLKSLDGIGVVHGRILSDIK